MSKPLPPAETTQKPKLTGIASWPDNLLYELFKCCQKELDAQFEPNPIIVPISQTCHEWRRVALAKPSLWKTVYLGYTRFDMGLAFIERARNQRLSVYLSSQRKTMREKKLVQFSNALSKIGPGDSYRLS
jgi:hypothetical protein